LATVSVGVNDRVFVLTGAGISAESGLPTFRAEDGLWAGHSVEEVCTPEAWRRNPWAVWKFYAERREAGEKAKPNPAHIVLAELEAKLGDRFFLCTQNVDDLHERAGSVRLIHMHGELNMAHCERDCGRPPVEDRAIYRSLDEVGRCACGGRRCCYRGQGSLAGFKITNNVIFGDAAIQTGALHRVQVDVIQGHQAVAADLQAGREIIVEVAITGEGHVPNRT